MLSFGPGTLPQPSREQDGVISIFEDSEENINVKACAGAGKSTLLQHLLAKSSVPVLILTYNKGLQIELEKKVPAPHVVSTFHALASSHFDAVCQDDDALANRLLLAASKDALPL